MAVFGVKPTKQELEQAINYIEETFGNEQSKGQSVETDSEVDEGHSPQTRSTTE